MNAGLKIFEQSYSLSFPQDHFLYPAIEPFNQGYIRVSNKHTIWFEEYGKPDGVPALVVHGGPGGGSNVRDSRLFDPQKYRIIIFDQRGCGKSTPLFEVEENSTDYLIEDMESLRKHLSVAQWVLLGGSWGSALSLAYAEHHPERVLGFILRGIFLATKPEFTKLWQDMGDFYPEVFEPYNELIPENERHDLAQAYYKRLMHTDKTVYLPAALAFYTYDMMCATLIDKSSISQGIDVDRAVALSKLFAHYCAHNFFIEPDQLMKNISCINNKPLYMVHGRYDIICRTSSAYRLHKAWPGSTLVIVPDAGHAQREPGITKALIEAGEALYKKI